MWFRYLLDTLLIFRVGPYDGSDGYVYKYDITTGIWTDISPVLCKVFPLISLRALLMLFIAGHDRYFGFGGLAVDLKKPGIIMVAALNSWWPDGQIWRSTDSGATWSRLWAWTNSPNLRDKYYTWDTSLAPWLSGLVGDSQVGWMMEALVIDPFDSDHWLYGTGTSIWGGHDLTTWDTKHNVSIKSLADGIEETVVRALISPPSGPKLFSGLGDVGGFSHIDLDKAPSSAYAKPPFSVTVSLDYAGNKPSTVVRPRYAAAILTLNGVQVRIGGTSIAFRQIAVSYDSGVSWSQDYDVPVGVSGGAVAISADADTTLWRDAGTNIVKYSRYTNAFTASIGIPPGAVMASDKKVRSFC